MTIVIGKSLFKPSNSVRPHGCGGPLKVAARKKNFLVKLIELVADLKQFWEK